MNFWERVIAVVSPSWAMSRFVARATLQQMEGFIGKSGYDAGKVNINTKFRQGSEAKEFAIPLTEVARLRWQSWNLWRNNPYAKKIVHSLQSKVIGKSGMMPESTAVNEDGSPNVEFRARAKKLWQSLQSGFDLRGMPGRGGLTMPGLQKLALRAAILSGEVLTRLVPIDPVTQTQRDLPIPFALQTIDAARLADQNHPATGTIAEGHSMYRGIELDGEGNRVAYWVNSYTPGYVTPNYGTAIRIPADQVAHLFVEEDIDQYRGVPWFAPAILSVRDTGDLQYNVLKASAMAACLVMAYRKPTGAQRFGLNQSAQNDPHSNSGSSDGSDLTDIDGNAITKIQPGMFVNLGKDGDLQGISPNQPNLNAADFIQHMLRGTAAAFPGVKGSTLTGDYRNSSFSSERSADNDLWPEVEEVQEWFAASFCQPIYESVIRAAFLSGYFDGIATADDFVSNPSAFTSATWQGPVSRSINPTDDVNASGLRMKFGLSSLQMECAKLNINWLDVLNNIAELYEIAKSKNIPEEVVNNILGVTSQDVIATAMAAGKPSPGSDPAKQDPAKNDDSNEGDDPSEKKDPSKVRSIRRRDYNPNQPRDDLGEWSSSGGGPEGAFASTEHAANYAAKVNRLMDQHGLPHVSHDIDENGQAYVKDHRGETWDEGSHDEFNSAHNDSMDANHILSQHGLPKSAKVVNESSVWSGKTYHSYKSNVDVESLIDADEEVKSANKILSNYADGPRSKLKESKGSYSATIDSIGASVAHDEIKKVNKRLTAYGLRPGVSIKASKNGVEPTHDVDEIHDAMDKLKTFKSRSIEISEFEMASLDVLRDFGLRAKEMAYA